jgi:hypothetical protein
MRINVGDRVRFHSSEDLPVDQANTLVATVIEAGPNMAFQLENGRTYSMPWQDLGDVGNEEPTYEAFSDSFTKEEL